MHTVTKDQGPMAKVELRTLLMICKDNKSRY